MDGPAPDLDALLRRFRTTRSPEDFAALFDGASPGLFRAAVRLTRDGAAAEDVLQETFLAVLRGVEGYDPARPALPWLTGVLQRRAADAWRRGERDRRPLPRVEEGAADPAGDAARNEERALVREALEDLEEPCRRAAVLRWRYGLEPGEIADALGENPGTIRSHLSRAKDRLEKRLRPSLLPALLLLPSPRGLDAVRAELLREAAALAPVAAGTAAVVVVTGELLMAKKGILAAVVLLLVGGAGWLAYTGGGEGGGPPDRGTNVSQHDTPPASLSATPTPPPPLPPPPPPPADLPPPVDLDACDRDLDLFGTTVDDEGKPVPGARVQTVRTPWARTNMQPARAHLIEEEGPATVSASDGTFVLHLSRGEQWHLRATAEGYGQGDREQCVAGERVVLVLRRDGPSLSVLCRDDAGLPVEGVRLRLLKRSASSYYGVSEYARTGVTGADGRFAFLHLSGGQATLMAEHDVLGIPPWAQPLIPDHGDLPVEFVLPAGRAVGGRVTDASTGEPLPGALVGSNWVMDRPVAAGADGRYLFPGWTGKGTSIMTAAAEGYGSIRLPVPPEGDLDFALEPAFAATGRVVDAAGAPVPGARVVASGGWQEGTVSGSDRAMATSGPDGGFTLRNLSHRASHDLAAEAEGHGRVFRNFASPAAGERTLDLGDIALTPPRAIEGRAIGPDGKPLPGRHVNLFTYRPADAGTNPGGGTSWPGSGELRRTDDLGRFRFPDLSPGHWGLKLVEVGAPIVEAEVHLPADRDVLDVLLAQKGGSLTFLVTDPEGNPLPGITVMSDMSFPHPTGGIRGSTSINAVTDAQGRASFHAIPEPDHRGGGGKGVSFQIQPYIGPKAPPWATARTEPLVPAGQEVTIVLQPSSTIAGRVLDPEGQPVPGLYVTAVKTDGTSIPGALGTCDAEGRFSLAVPAGTVVTLRIPGHGNDRGSSGTSRSIQTPFRGELAGIAAPASGLEFRATRLADDQSLSLLVLDADGRPVPAYQLFAYGSAVKSEGRGLSGSTDSEGRLRWEGLMGDTLAISPFTGVPEGTPEEIVPPPRTEVVPAGQEVILRFRRGVPLDGRVLLPDGTPAGGARLNFNLMGGGGGIARRPLAGDDGRFRLWFGEEQVVRIGASWKDDAGTWYLGESAEVRPGQGEVEVRIRPRE